MKLLVIFDIDGTVANLDHRLKYVRSKPSNWPAFNAAMKFDTPIPAVVEVCKRYIADPNVDVVFASGRSDDCRDDTVTWLEKNGMGGYDDIFMRKTKDSRSDDIIKKEILGAIEIVYCKKPDFVFDDRPRVVKMWRNEGIFVFDCNQSGVDF
jgi:predicted secreted acid phosphatase